MVVAADGFVSLRWNCSWMEDRIGVARCLRFLDPRSRCRCCVGEDVYPMSFFHWRFHDA